MDSNYQAFDGKADDDAAGLLINNTNDQQSSDADGKFDPNRPKDKGNFAWLTMIVCGAGFLFPFNTFIVASDFWEQRYAKYNPEFYIPLVYIWVGNLFLVINTFFIMDKIRPYNRIRLGFLFFILGFMLFPVIEESVLHHGLSREGGFYSLLLAVVMPAIGTGFQQGTYYGIASVLGQNYTIAMMLGETVAGFVVSLIRIITKAAFNEDTVSVESTYIFLGISSLFVVGCIVMSEKAFKTEFIDILFGQEFNQLKDHLSQDPVDENATNAEPKIMDVAKKIKLPLIAVTLAFFVQLVLFPGVVTTRTQGSLGTWMSVVTIFAFNFGDMLGRLLPFAPIKRLSPESWSEKSLVWFAVIELLFIPLIMLCSVPYGNPLIPGDWPLIIFTFLLAISSGYLGTLAMVLGPELCLDKEKEAAGNLMNLGLFLGLSLGVTLSLALLQFVK